MDLNPAVERAVVAANAAGPATAATWLSVLLADDEARPAMLLARLGASPVEILAIQQTQTDTLLPTDTILRKAREHSIRLKADPEFTTDLLLLAVLHEAPGIGVNLEAMDAAVRSPLVEGPTFAANEPVFVLPPATEQHDAARIVDANLNRAREALRVLDDYARFTLNDATLTEMMKTLRHRLADVSGTIPLETLLSARDTPHDVGTNVSVPSEATRGSPRHVAIVNCKRLQESLRSVEEFGKILKPHLAREAEAMRYEAYTLERALVGGSPLRERLLACNLYVLLSGSGCAASLEWTIAEAAAGGVDIVQLREKNLPDRELIERARNVRQWTRQAYVLFIVNDRPDIARLVDADGVHLGQDDMSVSEARRIMGPQPLIGISTHNAKQVKQAVVDGADYLGIGPTFPSTTKQFDTLAGLAFVRDAAAMTSVPLFALGGITAANVDEVVNAGVTRIAVSAAIAAAEEPQRAAKTLKARLVV